MVGLPGHGKSYSAIELFFLPAVKERRAIVTNIPLLPKFAEDYPDFKVQFFDLDAAAHDESLWDTIPPSCLILLDELWRIWPAGLKPADIPKRQLMFIKEHRHHIDESGREPDLVFLTQDLSDIAASIRNMVEQTIICSKLIDVGLTDRFRRDFYRGSIKGFSGVQSKFLDSEQCSYKPEVYQYYKSHTKSTVTGTVSIDKRKVVNKTIFTSWGFRVGVIFLVLLLLVSWFSFSYTKTGIDKMKTNSKSSPVEQKQHDSIQKRYETIPGQTRRIEIVKPPELPLSERWRLSGIFGSVGGRFKVLITDGLVNVRLDYSTYCKTERFESTVCEFRGEQVASYTGVKSRTDFYAKIDTKQESLEVPLNSK